MQFSQLAIFGPGLIGGSLALAARRRNACERISVWSRVPAERAAVQRLALADVVTDDPAKAVSGADLVVLCTPLAVMPVLAAQIAPHLATAAVVTDVASVKGSLVQELTAIFQPKTVGAGSRYVGAHPMAGAETSGLSAARADLFEGCVCLLTPVEGQTLPDATDAVSRFWKILGARVQHMTPQAHDEAVALISHLPHVLAAGLAGYVGGQPGEARRCAGPGWRDMTRLAGGSPEMWTEILSRNRAPVTNALRGILGKLREALQLLETGRDAELEEFLREAQHHRNHPSPGPRRGQAAKKPRT